MGVNFISLMVFADGVRCQFCWAMRALKDDTKETAFHVVLNYLNFFPGIVLIPISLSPQFPGGHVLGQTISRVDTQMEMPSFMDIVSPLKPSLS